MPRYAYCRICRVAWKKIHKCEDRKAQEKQHHEGRRNAAQNVGEKREAPLEARERADQNVKRAGKQLFGGNCALLKKRALRRQTACACR